MMIYELDEQAKAFFWSKVAKANVGVRGARIHG